MTRTEERKEGYLQNSKIDRISDFLIRSDRAKRKVYLRDHLLDIDVLTNDASVVTAQLERHSFSESCCNSP